MTHRVPWLTLLPKHGLGSRVPLPRRCPHVHLLIDEEAGLVVCDDCGADLDPIAMLVRIADEETQLEMLRRQIHADLAQGVLACARCGAVPGKEGL